jgi:enamine deaminase RidA (YjgF/YER057c/UK114 family)
VVDPIAALAEFLETSGGIALPDQSQGTASGEFAKRMVAATQAARAALLTAGGSTVAASSSTVAPPSVGNFSPTVASTAAANKVELTINIKPDEKGFIKALAEASQTNNVRAEITDGRIKFTIDTTTSGAR